MGDLGWNKIFFSILAAALIILGLREVSGLAFPAGYGHKHHGEEQDEDINATLRKSFAYVIPVDGGAAVTEQAPAAFDLGAALASADATAGERIMNAKCGSCHKWNEGGANGTGPVIYGIMGADIADVSGFQYSAVLNEKEGTWDYENMNAFLENPSGWAPGTKMTFAGLRKGSDRADVLAFLETISPNAPAMPEPAPEEGESEGEAVEDAAAPAGETGMSQAEEASVEAEEAASEALVEDAAVELVEPTAATDEGVAEVTDEVMGEVTGEEMKDEVTDALSADNLEALADDGSDAVEEIVEDVQDTVEDE